MSLSWPRRCFLPPRCAFERRSRRRSVGATGRRRAGCSSWVGTPPGRSSRPRVRPSPRIVGGGQRRDAQRSAQVTTLFARPSMTSPAQHCMAGQLRRLRTQRPGPKQLAQHQRPGTRLVLRSPRDLMRDRRRRTIHCRRDAVRRQPSSNATRDLLTIIETEPKKPPRRRRSAGLMPPCLLSRFWTIRWLTSRSRPISRALLPRRY